MQQHDAKRVAIIIEAIMESRLRQALETAGVTGYSVLPVLGGSGRSGAWSRDDTFTRGGGMVQVICIVRPDRLDELLDAAFSVVDSHIGVVTISDCKVLRAERF
ncbi:P-II family nitrogen regulator [Primorskyibacter sp. S187A]|uniref:P-II family nitrogen regulator n=1 Tax=Primorskyibacter sp. S187A TaxID=3415130 RepID=UPI003C7A071A